MKMIQGTCGICNKDKMIYSGIGLSFDGLCIDCDDKLDDVKDGSLMSEFKKVFGDDLGNAAYDWFYEN